MGILRFSAVLSACVLLGACTSKSSPKASDSGPPSEQKALVNYDIQKFANIDVGAIRDFDRDNLSYFSKIFNGTDSTAVLAYLNQRIHYYWSPDELNSYTLIPSQFQYSSWQKTDNDLATGDDDDKAQVAAANIGMVLWLSGQVNRVNVSLTNGTTTVNVDRPETGVMLIGPGYVSTVTVKDQDGNDQVVSIPEAYRQGTLLHEARHSDCTGGVTQADLDVLRNATSYADTERNFKKQCGHLHSTCPAGHPLEGLLACDDLPWGAYTVGYVYGKALVSSLTGRDRDIMDAFNADNYSRLIFDSDSMMAGGMGEPDMTSEGVR